MSLFVDFEEEEIILLVSLPYRVGLWVSHVDDDASTEYDDVQEAKALQQVLQSLAKNKNKPFTASVVQETLKYPDHWDRWAADLSGVLVDAQKAGAMIKARMAEDDAAGYKKALLDIAQSVALAFGEYAGDGHDLNYGSGLGGLINKVKGAIGGGVSDDPDNISVAEQEALEKLEHALSS